MCPLKTDRSTGITPPASLHPQAVAGGSSEEQWWCPKVSCTLFTPTSMYPKRKPISLPQHECKYVLMMYLSPGGCSEMEVRGKDQVHVMGFFPCQDLGRLRFLSG